MSDQCCSVEMPSRENHVLKKVLWLVFAINLAMFLVEIIAGYLYQSTALMADSLDMLSDASIYGVSIFVLAKSSRVKAQVSLMKGFVMTVMALYVAYELVGRFLNPVVPDGQVITVIGFIALIANAVSFWLLSRHRNGDINIRSAWVCSRNDMTANIGVITAGVLVLYSGSNWPDLLIGAAIALLVLVSSFKVITDSIKEIKISRK